MLNKINKLGIRLLIILFISVGLNNSVNAGGAPHCMYYDGHKMDFKNTYENDMKLFLSKNGLNKTLEYRYSLEKELDQILIDKKNESKKFGDIKSMDLFIALSLDEEYSKKNDLNKIVLKLCALNWIQRDEKEYKRYLHNIDSKMKIKLDLLIPKIKNKYSEEQIKGLIIKIDDIVKKEEEKVGIIINKQTDYKRWIPTYNYILKISILEYLKDGLINEKDKTVSKENTILNNSCERYETNILKDRIYSSKYSPDGKSLSFVLTKNTGKYGEKSKEILIKDGIRSKEYNEDISNLTYSPDGKSFYYVINLCMLMNTMNCSGKVIMVKDGVEINKYDNIKYLYNTGYNTGYSPSGKNFVLIVEKDGKNIVVKNGIESKKYDEVFSNIDYSFDEKSFSFTAVRDGKTFIVKDGVEIDNYDHTYNLLYSPNNNNFAFIAERDGKSFVVRDGIESNKYDSIKSLEYSKDGNNFAFIAEKDGKNFVVKDGVVGSKYDFNIVSINNIFLNEKDFIIQGEKDQKYFIAKDGVKGEEFYNMYSLKYSKDGKGFIFSTGQFYKYFIKNGVKSKGYKSTYTGIFDTSSNGDSYAVEISNGLKQTFILKDGVEIKKYSNSYSPIYSPDGKDFIFVAQSAGKYFIVKNGVEGEKYDSKILNLTYSKDGSSFAFIVQKNGKNFVVKDGIKGNEYNSISRIEYSDNGKSLAIFTISRNLDKVIVEERCN